MSQLKRNLVGKLLVLYRARLSLADSFNVSAEAAICMVTLAGIGINSVAAQEPVQTPEAISATVVDASRIEGHAKCIDCHAQEVKAWQASKHATRAFDLLRTAPTSIEYAEKLGIRTKHIARDSLCTTCHATQQRDEVGRLKVISGVSCEACHNASGGEDGWLNLHAAYGPRGTRRENESPAHFTQRTAACDTAGQFRSSNAYYLVKRCFDCHVVSNEALAEAGHDHGDGFEFLSKSLGEVRHNFFLDRHMNAEVATLWADSLHNGTGRNAAGRKRVLFVLAQMIDLETSLTSLATATDENDFSDLMVERIEDAWGLLAEDLLEELEDTKIPEVEQATEAAEPVLEKLDDDGFNPEDAKLYLDAAAAVRKAALQFSKRDGNKLSEIDELELLPEGPFKGVFQQ